MKRILSGILVLLLFVTGLPISAMAQEDTRMLVLPSSLTKIDEDLFAQDSSITELVVPNSVSVIGSRAFEGCIGLTKVTITSQRIEIADDAFKDCSANIVFRAYKDSDAMTWALAHGYKCESLDGGPENLNSFTDFVSKAGFSTSMLMSGTFASKCLIIRTTTGQLPDIAEYNPISVYMSEENLYYVQFDDEGNTEDCFAALQNEGLQVEPDRVGESDNISAQGVTIAENWGSNDTMGFDIYAPFVAQHASGDVTIAVIDSGVKEDVWAGKMSQDAASFVGGSAFSDTVRHGSKVASILNDCLGTNRSRVTLLPIKIVTNSSLYRTSVIIEGIKHAISHGADIINLSLGWDISEGISPEISYQISKAQSEGILVVAAAGNGSGEVMFPANCSGVLAVSALTYSSSAGYSVRSRTGGISYTAPGLYLSTVSYPRIDQAGDTIGSASTSFAAPQITAALALIKLDSTHSGSPTSVLNSCCLDLGPEGLSSSAFGHGLPQLDRLASIDTIDIVLKNLDEGNIPSRLWLGDHDNDFMLGWDIIPSDASNKKITVSTSDSTVATIRQYGNTSALISAKGVGEAVITVTNSNITKQHRIVVEQPVTSIILTGSNGTMITGDEVKLAAAVLPEEANNKAVNWKTSNEEVISVTQEGKIIAKKAGQATVTCEAMDGYGTTGHLDITVIDVPDAESVSLTAKEKEIINNQVSLEVNETLTLEASILPERALQEVYYSAYPKNVVSVTENGIIKAESTGTATIVATATTGRNITTYLTVIVIISPESISVGADKSVLDIGETTAMTAELLPAETTETTVVWSSQNPTIARVNSSNGVVTAINSGTTEITGTTVNGKKASVSITVRQPITITFDGNGGICNETARRAYSGYAIGVLPPVSREYWSLVGWYTERNGGTKVNANSSFTEDTTLYAHWQGLPYTVTFDANSGSCDTESMTGKVGSKLGTLPLPIKAYYTFKGWYTAAQGGTEVTADYSQTTTTDITVFAQWTNNPYTMSFNANGGSCDTASKNGVVDSAIGLLPTPERPYYSFTGWFTATDGGEEITESYTQSTTAAITIYAHWKPMTYVMTFDANGGECNTVSRAYPVDTDIGELPVPTRNYYSFTGWYTEDEESVQVTAAYQHATTEGVTVRARWSALPFTISFDANGGTCSVEKKTAYVDAEIGNLPNPTRTYYTFDGWYTEKTGGSLVDAAYVQTTTTSLTLHAHWTPKTYVMTFNANGGTCSDENKIGTVGASIGELPTPTRSYYSFDGWFTVATGGTEIIETYMQNTDEVITVYAHWTPGTYTMTLDANGGTSSISSKTGTVDLTIGELPVPTRNYYTFDGWYTATGTKVESSYVQSTTSDITVQAHWTAMNYTMEFNANGGTTPVSRINTFSVDTPVGELPTPTRTYYDFDGWYTAASGGTRITTKYQHPNVTTITVYAHWIPNTYKMTFNANGGTCSTTSKTYSVDTAIGSLPSATRDYYTFDGWYTAASGGSKIDTMYKQNKPDNITVYAHWALKPTSGWVLPSEVPSGAQIVDRKTETTNSTSPTLSGWTRTGESWKQTGSGSVNYASFPGGFDTGHWIYTSFNKSALSGGEADNGSTKRDVSNSWSGYVYWHWMYNTSQSNGTSGRAIYHQYGYGPDNGFLYNLFGAFTSSNGSYNSDTYYCNSQGIRNYIIPERTAFADCQGATRWFRFDYYTSYYTDYQKQYSYSRELVTYREK